MHVVLNLFLHSPFCRAEGLCQQTAIKVHHHRGKMLKIDQSEWSRWIDTALWLVDTVHEGYPKSINWFWSIVTEVRVALLSVQLYRTDVNTVPKTGIKYKCTETKLIEAKCVHWKCEKLVFIFQKTEPRKVRAMYADPIGGKTGCGFCGVRKGICNFLM